jgi:hypothetical protein
VGRVVEQATKQSMTEEEIYRKITTWVGIDEEKLTANGKVELDLMKLASFLKELYDKTSRTMDE